MAESIDAWSLASCSALSEAVELPPGVVEPPVVELPPVGVDPELDCVDVPELGVVPDPLGVEPPEPEGLEPLPEAPLGPVPAPDDEPEDEDELSSLASAVSAFASAAWSVWTCCWADWALASALRHAAVVELPDVDVELPVAVVVAGAGGVVVGVVVGAVVGVVPVDEPEQAVCACLSAASAVAVSASAACCAFTTACWAWVRVAVEPLGPVAEGAVVVVVVVAAVVAVVAVDEPALDDVELELVEDWDDSSSASLASAAVRVVWAEVTSFSRVVVCKEASVSPAVTCWFKETSTAETVPATWNSAVAWWTGEAVPVTSRVLLTEALVAVAVR